MLQWYEVKEPGYYWLLSPEDRPAVVRLYDDRTYCYAGNEHEYSLDGEYPQSEYRFVKLVEPDEVGVAALQHATYSEQKRKFEALNATSKFPKRIEGYWRNKEELPAPIQSGRSSFRTHYEKEVSLYPWPVVMDIPEFDRQDFINHLVEIEEVLEQVLYRGMSFCRLTGENRGCGEYEFNGWSWPAGYLEYIRLGVPPSRAFYNFIMGEKAKYRVAAALPSYNREEGE